MPNDLLVTTTDILGIEVAKDYSGASGIYVDNVNNIISITGDVGKEYSGVNPIVVNNDENLISANSAPIGVQEPLYFVQDDDEAVIIGLSGEYVTPSDIAGKLDTSSFESWQQGQYTNDLTAINQKINEVSSNIPSLEGYATEQLVEETSANIVSQIPSTAGLASETYVQEQTSAKASKSDLETVSGNIVNLIPDVSNYYTKDETSGAAQLAEAFSQIGPGGDEEVNELVHSNSASWNEVSSKLDESTFQEASGLFLTAIPQEYITESELPNLISAKLDTTSFADVSGSFLTAHQSLEGYATEQFVEDTSASITALIPTDYYPNSNPSGFITGVDLSQYYQKNETSSKEEISAAIAAIPLGDEEVNQAVHTNSATWNSVTDKLDTTAQVVTSYSTAFIDGTSLVVSLNDKPLQAYRAVSAQDAGVADKARYDYDGNNLADDHNSLTSLKDFVQSNSAKIDDTVSSYQTNSGTFLTAVDLTPYQTVAGMTAYQPVGDYATTSQLNTTSSFLSGAIDYVSANSISGSKYGTVFIKNRNIEGTNSALNIEENQDVTTVYNSQSAYLSDLGNEPYTSVKISSEQGTGSVYGLYHRAFSFLDYSVNIIFNGSVTDVPIAWGSDSLVGVYSQYSKPISISAYYTTSAIKELAWKSDIPSTAGLATESYVQTNSAVLTGMIDGKQDTLTFGYDEQDRISAINSSALAGGGDVPEDVMVETNLEYNAVNEISGYNGSAIAQYGAEKQWLVHDGTLCHLNNSAQYALGVNLSAVAQLLGVDETVLWSGDSQISRGSYIELNETPFNFDRVRIEYAHQPGWGGKHSETIPEFGKSASGKFVLGENWFRAATGYNNMWHDLSYETFDSATNRIYHNSGFQGVVTNTAWNSNGDLPITYYKVIGIGRKN